MINRKKLFGKKRVVVDFNKDIFMSVFDNEKTLEVIFALSDKTSDFMVDGKLDLEKDYDMSKQDFNSLDPSIVMNFKHPESIRNMIVILQDAEKLLVSKLPKRKSRKG